VYFKKEENNIGNVNILMETIYTRFRLYQRLLQTALETEEPAGGA
jgi:hypothetical protein